MNHCVPNFEMEDDYLIHTSSGVGRPKKPFMAEEEIMELLWQNGQVIVQSQNQRPSPPGLRKQLPESSKYDAVLPADMDIRPLPHHHHHQQQQHLFMQEDEMASWLHYPLVDDEFSADLLYPAQTITTAATNSTHPQAPPPPPPQHMEAPSASKSAGVAATVVDSCDTPAVANPITRASLMVAPARDAMVTSSPGDSSASAEPPPPPPPPASKIAAEDRKRKRVEAAEEAECQSEDVEFESCDTKKQARGTSSAKRTRAAEVHNLSERKRRDRINEKMKALQELIPRCNKSDKASMLDEAIEYLKSLQLQVQMMSMGCGMVPMMFPGIQQYMPPMGMGIGMGMGMGMGMDMSMNRPMMPFPNMLAGSAMTGPAAAAHLGPRFPMPTFHMPSVSHPSTTEPSRVQPADQSDQMYQPFVTQNPTQTCIPNFSDPNQQYFGSHQMKLPVLQQSPGMVQQPSTSKPSTSRGPENPENHHSG